MGYFTGKVAFVTGAASGIGRSLCEALCAEGATVYAADIQKKGLDELVESAAGAGEIRGITLDVTRQDDVARVIRDVVEECGRLDLIINNAVIRVVGDFRHTELDDIRRSTDVNLWGVIYGTKAAYEIMAAYLDAMELSHPAAQFRLPGSPPLHPASHRSRLLTVREP